LGAGLPASREESFQIRQEALAGGQGRRMKPVIAELATENELLRERSGRMEDQELFLW